MNSSKKLLVSNSVTDVDRDLSVAYARSGRSSGRRTQIQITGNFDAMSSFFTTILRLEASGALRSTVTREATLASLFISRLSPQDITRLKSLAAPYGLDLTFTSSGQS